MQTTSSTKQNRTWCESRRTLPTAPLQTARKNRLLLTCMRMALNLRAGLTARSYTAGRARKIEFSSGMMYAGNLQQWAIWLADCSCYVRRCARADCEQQLVLLVASRGNAFSFSDEGAPKPTASSSGACGPYGPGCASIVRFLHITSHVKNARDHVSSGHQRSDRECHQQIVTRACAAHAHMHRLLLY